MRIFLALCLGLLACTTSASELYRWVDEQGKVHYGDQPPPKQDKEALKLQYSKAPVSPTPAASALGPVTPRIELREGGGVAQFDQGKCDSAKQRLLLYKTAQRLERPDEFGRVRNATDEERKALIEGAEQIVARECAGESAGLN